MDNSSLPSLNDDIMLQTLNDLPVSAKFVMKRVSKRFQDLVWKSNRNIKSLSILPYPKSHISTHFCIDRRLGSAMGLNVNLVVGDSYYSFKQDRANNLKKILKEFSRLECIELDCITNEIIGVLAEDAKKLRFLTFHEASEITATMLGDYANFCQRIKKIGIGYDVDESLFMRCFPSLRSVYFVTTPDPEKTSSVKLENILSLSPDIRNLILANKSLDLSIMNGLSTSEIKTKILDSNLKKLKMFEMYGTPMRIDDVVMIELLLGMSELKILNLNTKVFQNSNSLMEIIKMKHITSLELIHIESGTDLTSLLSNWPRMQCLKLEAGSRGDSGWFYADDVNTIVVSCPELQHLRLKTLLTMKSRNRATPADRCLEELGRLRRLRTLELPFSDVNDDKLEVILTSCPRVEAFNFEGAKLNDPRKFLKDIVNYTKRRGRRIKEINLEHVNIDGDHNLIEALKAEAESLPRCVKICFCTNSSGNSNT